MKKYFIQDILAGLTVSFAALSLGAAFGIMSGRGAFAGMIGAAVIPIITSLFGGTKVQASGPTAPMTAVTAVLVAKAYDNFGAGSALANEFITLVLLMASLFIVIAGALKLGKYIQFVPQVVVLGFMNGIGVLIWYDQLKKLFGLSNQKPLEGEFTTNIFIVLSTLAIIYLLPYFLKLIKLPDSVRRFVPSMFVAITLVTLVTSTLQLNVEHVQIENAFNSFSEFISYSINLFPHSEEIFHFETLKKATPIALQLCLLAYLDSLLTSLIIDKMTKQITKPNKELMTQGLANGVTSFFQGIPGAQATIRSVLLIKEGAQTRLAGVFVGLFALVGFLVFSKLIMLITSAVFVGVLLKAGLDVIDRDFINAYLNRKWIKNKKRNFQMVIVLVTTVLTFLYDLNIAVVAGTILFYLAKKYLNLKDVEDNFVEVQSEDIAG
jgi:sulfate permease, SulP family